MDKWQIALNGLGHRSTLNLSVAIGDGKSYKPSQDELVEAKNLGGSIIGDYRLPNRFPRLLKAMRLLVVGYGKTFQRFL